jgi:hypothetical protein
VAPRSSLYALVSYVATSWVSARLHIRKHPNSTVGQQNSYSDRFFIVFLSLSREMHITMNTYDSFILTKQEMSPPKECYLDFEAMVRLVWSNDPESYAGY